MKKYFFFDLDGTLVDSVAGIRKSIEFALKNKNIYVEEGLLRNTIGPPLSDIFKSLVSDLDESLLESLIEDFVFSYDSVHWCDFSEYADWSNILNSLKRQGGKVFLVTNKRSFPTNKIIGKIGLFDVFDKILSIDSDLLNKKNKSDYISNIIGDYKLPVEDCIYIGDTEEDYKAAAANGMDFIWVSWGYAVPKEGFRVLDKPEDIVLGDW